MSDLDFDAIRVRVGAYAKLACTKPEFLDQAQLDGAARAAAEDAVKLLLGVERLRQATDRSWAETILTQRDEALDAVARMRTLPNSVKRALDGGEWP